MYEYILDELNAAADEKYRVFHSKLIPGVDTVFLGVRIPQLRKMAKEIARGDWQQFLKEYDACKIYELVMLCGMVIANAKCDFEFKLDYLTGFVPKIDNWAICDVICGELKAVKKHQEEMYDFILQYLNSDRTYEIRFAVVILMQYFIDDEHIDAVLAWYGRIKSDEYYVKMAVAWGLSVCFVKFRDKTLHFLQNCAIDTFTYNKALQKMRESLRVSAQDKEMLKGMKR